MTHPRTPDTGERLQGAELVAWQAEHECCQRGDWTGAEHQPDEAYLYVPHVRVPPFRGWPNTYFSAETTEAYRWTCEYCGRTGTRAELSGEA